MWLWILRVLELGPEEGARGPGSPGTAFSKRCFLSVCGAPGTPWAQQCPDMDAPTLSSRGLCAKGVRTTLPTRQNTSAEVGAGWTLQLGTQGAKLMAGVASGGQRTEGLWEEDTLQFRPEEENDQTWG